MLESKHLFDEQSATWIYILNYLEEELKRVRTQNDSLSNDEIKTASYRGQIQLLKTLAKLPLLSRKAASKEVLRLSQRAHR